MKILSYNAKKHIAEIVWQERSRYISAEAAIRMHVNLNEDIPEEIIPDLLAASEEILCRQYLYDQIARYYKTAKGYRDKLIEKGYSKPVARAAVENAIAEGYIDDARFAERYVETNRSKKGYYALKAELVKKGVAVNIIEDALSDLGDREEELLRLIPKLVKTCPATPEEKGKLSRKLASRGFTYEEIHHAINIFCKED